MSDIFVWSEGDRSGDNSKVRFVDEDTEKAEPAKSRAKRSYRASAQTRRDIVERAAEVFGKQGFHGASLRGIARAAGVDHSTLIHHFNDKTGLLEEVLKWRDTEAIPDDLGPNISVQDVVSAIVNVAHKNQETPGITQLFSMMSVEAGEESHPARAYLQRRHQVHLSVFGSIIESRRSRGLLADNGLTSQQEAARIVATWEGLEVLDRLHPGLLDVPKALEVTLSQALGLGEDEGGETIEVPTEILERWEQQPDY